jgi:NAD(P)-dependent dehydrogenase (short-subunit alcohol dehydrogenase family)
MSNGFFSLADKTCVVTGAASGIGEAIAERFTRAGADVFVADLNEEGARTTAARLEEAGGRAHPVALDVSDPDACRRFAASFREIRPEGLDVLVNNAGIGAVGTILETEPETLDRLHAVNVRGVFNMSRSFIAPMLGRGFGCIVNMASIGGLVGIRDRVAYCATKFAVVGLTKCMALDHAGSGVRINCVCPARVRTPFVDARLKEYDDPEAAYRQMSASQPIGRMADPGEIAAVVHYLASDESAFMTGSGVVIDGGLSAGT